VLRAIDSPLRFADFNVYVAHLVVSSARWLINWHAHRVIKILPGVSELVQQVRRQGLFKQVLFLVAPSTISLRNLAAFARFRLLFHHLLIPDGCGKTYNVADAIVHD